MIILIQYISYILFHYFIKAVLRAKVIVPKNHVMNKPILIVSNHTSRIDPFLLVLLPFSLIRKLIPIYFMTGDNIYNKSWFKPLIHLFGAYPVKKWGWSFDQILNKTIEKLRKNHTIMIFPEGQIMRKHEKVVPKPGVAYIVSRADVTILPIKIEGTKDRTFLDIVKKGSITIKIGKPSLLRYKKKNINLQKEAEKIMKIVYAL